MPQASQELRDKFPGDDQEAFAVLEENFLTSRGGIIYPIHPEHTMSKREVDAIDYLCDEWDYGYSPTGALNVS